MAAGAVDVHRVPLSNADHLPITTRTQIRERSKYQEHDFLYHGGVNVPDSKAALGRSDIRHTRFHQGFYRRGYDQIKPDVERKEKDVEKERRTVVQRSLRAEYQTRMNGPAYSGYDIITGADKPEMERRPRIERKHYSTDVTRLKDPLPEQRMSNSVYRFHDPDLNQRGDVRKDYRSKLLNAGGVLHTAKLTAVLGSGLVQVSKEVPGKYLPSAGVKDNFGNHHGYVIPPIKSAPRPPFAIDD